MQITFSTGTFYQRGLGYSLALAGEAGYDGVELALGPEYSFSGIRGLQRAAQKHTVPILSVHPPFMSIPGWPRQLSRSIPYLAQVTHALGVQNCVVHIAGFSSPHTPRAQRFISALQEALRSTGNTLRIGLENSQYYRRKQRFYLDDLRALASFAGEHGCGVTFDTCHAAASGEDILACYEIVRPVLCNVHLNDVIFRRDVPHTHIPPGKGQLPLDRFLGLLARDRYQGLVTLEIYPSRVGLMGHGRHLREMQEAIHFVRSAIAEPVTK
ncbi:MAG: sugar phosphate isomerase/epimerase family protein [Ktedonobacterales bacterium]